MPTANAFHRDERIGVIEALQTAASERGVKVSIVAPDSLIQETLRALNRKTEAKAGRKLINHRRILEATTPNTVTVLVVDRNASLVIEQKDDSQPDFDKAIGVATYSTRNSTVLANVRFFERMWEEVELREREEVRPGKGETKPEKQRSFCRTSWRTTSGTTIRFPRHECRIVEG